MKKFLLPVLLLLSIASIGQYTQQQSYGGPKTLTNYPGGVKVYGSTTLGNFADTTAANADCCAKFSSGGFITTGTSLATQKFWMRNFTATGWLEVPTAASPAGANTWQQVLTAGRTGDSAIIDNAATGESYVIRNRNVSLGFPVMTLKPVSNNKNFAIDFMPTGTPGDFGANPITWGDWCDANVSSSAVLPVRVMRVGISSTHGVIQTEGYNGASARPMKFLIGTDNRIELSTTNTGTFNIGKINQIQSLSGDYVGYSLFNTNNAVAESNPIVFVGQDLGSSRFGYWRWNNNATSVLAQGYRLPNQTEIISNVGATGGLVLGSLSLNSKIDFVTSPDGFTNTRRMRVDSAGNVILGANLVSFFPTAAATTMDFRNSSGSAIRMGDASGTFSVIEFNASTYNLIFGLAGHGTGNPVLYLKQATNNAGMGGNTNPTARLHIGAGTTGAGTAPLKLTSGPLMTAAEAGAIEALNDDLYYTGSTGNRRTVITNDATQTLSNKFIAPRVVSMADATSFTPTSATADLNIHVNTQAVGTLTANAPSGSPVEGQLLELRIKSTNVQTFAWNAIYRGTLPTVTSGGDLTDYFLYQWNAVDTKWDFLTSSMGH